MNKIKYAVFFVFLVGGGFLLAHVAYTNRFNARKSAFRIVQSLRLINFNKQQGREIQQTLTLTDNEHKHEGHTIKHSNTVNEAKPDVVKDNGKDEAKIINKPESEKVPSKPAEIKTNAQEVKSQTTLPVKETVPIQQSKPNIEHANKPVVDAQPPVKPVVNKPKVETSVDVIPNKNLPDCPKGGKELVGLMYVDQTFPGMEELEKQMASKYGGTVEKGGWWKPSDCKAVSKVAIIIPYRNRVKQLQLFLKHMHPILQRQLLDYRIFVIEQATDDPFNRAALFNVGFKEALKKDNYDCFVFTDVDLLPENDRNNYGCPTSPRHMSVAVDKFNYQLPYASIFGGVGAFKKSDFETINGFSNMFWGWGGEDDDLYQRIRSKGFQLSRPSLQVGRYTMVKVFHFQSSGADPNRLKLIKNAVNRMPSDGLNSLNYEVIEFKELRMVTIVTIHFLQ